MINTNMKENEKPQAKIYIACLAAYNNGILHGAWIVPNSDEEELQKQIDAILKTSNMSFAEEWAVHDYDNFHNLGEYPSIENICKVQQAIEKHDYELVNAYLQYNNDIDSLDDIEDLYVGHYHDFVQYAEEYVIDCDSFNNIPDHLQYYFDYEKYARDLQDNYYVVESDNYGVYIFRTY